MNNLESILALWKKDCIIDEIQLDEASRDSAKLHSKYLDLYSVNRLKQKDLDLKYKIILRDKFKHYGGKLSQQEMDHKGWEYDPLGGHTVLKGDLDKWYDADEVIQEHQKRMAVQDEVVSTLKEIMENIKWRHQTIKNMIEWRKFTSGI